MVADSQTEHGPSLADDDHPTFRAVVRTWWGRHGLAMRTIAVLAVIFVAANAVYWGWFLACVTVSRPSTMPLFIVCP